MTTPEKPCGDRMPDAHPAWRCELPAGHADRHYRYDGAFGGGTAARWADGSASFRFGPASPGETNAA